MAQVPRILTPWHMRWACRTRQPTGHRSVRQGSDTVSHRAPCPSTNRITCCATGSDPLARQHERRSRLVAHHLPRAWLRAWHVDRSNEGDRTPRAGAWLGAWLAERDGHERQGAFGALTESRVGVGLQTTPTRSTPTPGLHGSPGADPRLETPLKPFPVPPPAGLCLRHLGFPVHAVFALCPSHYPGGPPWSSTRKG